MVSVEQKTKLGKLGLYALLERGFAGPNYDISDCKVEFSRIGESIHVHFYDMGCLVNKKSMYYQEIDSLLGKE